MRQIIIILPFLTLGLTSQGQNFIDYYNLANEAEHDFIDNGNLTSAKKTFISLEKKFGRLLYKDYFYLGIINYLDNDTANGYKYLAKFTELFGAPTNYIPDYKTKFPKLNISTRAIAQLESLENTTKLVLKDSTVFNTKYKPIIDSVKRYLELDQRNRRHDVKFSAETDIQIQKQYLTYLKKHGLPNPCVFGDDYLIILFHIEDLKIQETYLTFFKNEIIKGNAYPFTCALITDKRLHPNETVYGSYSVKYSSKTSAEQIKINRRKIGMSIYYNGSNNFPRTFTKETFDK